MQGCCSFAAWLTQADVACSCESEEKWEAGVTQLMHKMNFIGQRSQVERPHSLLLHEKLAQHPVIIGKVSLATLKGRCKWLEGVLFASLREWLAVENLPLQEKLSNVQNSLLECEKMAEIEFLLTPTDSDLSSKLKCSLSQLREKSLQSGKTVDEVNHRREDQMSLVSSFRLMLHAFQS